MATRVWASAARPSEESDPTVTGKLKGGEATGLLSKPDSVGARGGLCPAAVSRTHHTRLERHMSNAVAKGATGAGLFSSSFDKQESGPHACQPGSARSEPFGCPNIPFTGAISRRSLMNLFV